MKTLLDLTRFYNQPDSKEVLALTMPVLVEACRLDVSVETALITSTAITDYDVEAYLNSQHIVVPYNMHVVIAPEHRMVYQTATPVPLFGDALSYDLTAATFFKTGVGMSYRKWALAVWEDNADAITVLAVMDEERLDPEVITVTNVEGRTNACIFTPEMCYVRIDPSKQ